VKEKKYETVDTTSRMLQSTLNIMSQTSNLVSMASFRPPSQSATISNVAEATASTSQHRTDLDTTSQHRTDLDTSSLRHISFGDENLLSPMIAKTEHNGRPHGSLSNLSKIALHDDTSLSQPIININISSEM
jgi:hypothetical protein